MELEVRWSPEAIEDLSSIAEYIARDSENYARSVVSEVLSVARSTAEFPLLDRAVPELDDPQLRERFIYSYRLVYRVEPERILIVAVVHGRRLLENVPGRFSE